MAFLHSISPEFPTEIGGYFDLDLPNWGDPFPQAGKFQSGRAALRALIECAGIKKIMAPAYICDSAIQAITDSGASIKTYYLDELLFPKQLPSILAKNEAFLYINYFGLCQPNVNQLLQSVPSRQLIVDNCQALLALPNDALGNIYSPRKFVGVPDGGLAISNYVKIKRPEQQDSASITKMKHLLLRMASTAKVGYLDYLESEKNLNNTVPLKMSLLTQRLLASIDMEKVKRRRRENFLVLAEGLGEYNTHNWNFNSEAVPLCYPLIVNWNTNSLKRKLIEQGIYIPTYWPDTGRKFLYDSVEHRLANNCLAIPCDQRYTSNQMHYLTDILISNFNNQSRSIL